MTRVPPPFFSLPVLGFAAWSGTGKTTLLTRLIPWLRAQGLRVALIKHAHHDFDIDHPGKDSPGAPALDKRDRTSQSLSRTRARRVNLLRRPRPPCGRANTARPQWLYASRSSAIADYAPSLRSPWRAAYALRQAGAGQVLIASRRRFAWMMEYEQETEPVLSTLVSRLDTSHLDLVLVEGFRHARFPKIELHRVALERPLLFPDDDDIIAVACDAPLSVAKPIPVLDLNDPPAIGGFMLERLGLTPPSPVT